MPKESVKNKVLQILIGHRGTHYSGEVLADELKVSRTAVWKAVAALRSEGYDIIGTTNKGYSLSEETDILSGTAVVSYLTPEAASFYRIETETLTASTNLDLRDRGLQGEPEGLVIAAEEQTQGRGRQGRHFYSPKNTGVYFSILLRPVMAAQEAVLITAAAASASARAVEKICGEPVLIKWVNDLYMRGRKINGILTEAILSMETGRLDQAVLGIGFNLYTPKGGWPDEISTMAGSIFTEETDHMKNMRSRLTAEVLNEFLPLYLHLEDRTFLEDYRARQLVFNQEVEVMSGDPPYRTAIPVDIDRDCHLLIRYTDEPEGTLHAVGSGEVRVKPSKYS